MQEKTLHKCGFLSFAALSEVLHPPLLPQRQALLRRRRQTPQPKAENCLTAPRPAVTSVKTATSAPEELQIGEEIESSI